MDESYTCVSCNFLARPFQNTVGVPSARLLWDANLTMYSAERGAPRFPFLFNKRNGMGLSPGLFWFNLSRMGGKTVLPG